MGGFVGLAARVQSPDRAANAATFGSIKVCGDTFFAMTTDTGSLRRRPPAAGELAAELRTVLTAAGLPCADPDAERASAVGLLIANGEGGTAEAEWFISQTGRAAAASEQTLGVPY